MPDQHSVNRRMFWRVLRRSVFANNARLFVILLALSTGAAVSAALLNLQVDAKRRITTEFRAFGANVLIAPDSVSGPSTLPDKTLDELPKQTDGQDVSAAEFLYVTGNATAYTDETDKRQKLWSGAAVIAGYRFIGEDLAHSIPYAEIEGHNHVVLDKETCEVGQKLAQLARVHEGSALVLGSSGSTEECIVDEVRSFGSAEDSQILVSLDASQRLARRPGQISLIQINVPGSPRQIQNYVSALRQKFPDADVRPIRQFSEGEARLSSKISGILTATIAVVLLLTALCVMAAMTNVAMERKNDVGLMKAIGGSVRRVLRFFLVEAALLGLVGGLIGAAAGILLSIALGKAVFGVAAQPRFIVYPVSVALTVIVAILASYPLRHLAHVRPASVFRGEE